MERGGLDAGSLVAAPELSAKGRTSLVADAFMHQRVMQMKSLEFGRYAASSCVAAAMLAGCGGSQSPIGAPGALPHALGIASSSTAHRTSGSSYHVVHRFKHDRKDGSYPTGLTNVHGTLYGVTTLGGASGVGTIYTLTTGGEENVLHSFSGGLPNPGAKPYAPPVDVKGTLYGTTLKGGSGGARNGTVYSVSASGSVTILHSFGGHSDGQGPAPGKLISVHGTLYGTTTGGGARGLGTVYSISTSGAEKVLYSFKGGSDGSGPSGGLIDANGTLFGATAYGGGSPCYVNGFHVGCGTIYNVTTGGAEKVLYRFQGPPDGDAPDSALIDVGGTLYGTTYEGGTGGGTVYSVTTSGNESVLYSFAGGSDGVYPGGGLIDVNGTLYGTTQYGGGGTGCPRGLSCGIVFSVSTNGAESVLYRFAGGTDGMWPMAPLTDVKGTVYGTTPYGGGSDCVSGGQTVGCGTVFALTP
jgi:uncharacterized repeat protein (TIGR03803 family)